MHALKMRNNPSAKKKKNWPKANFFFKQIGIFRKKGYSYEKFY